MSLVTATLGSPQKVQAGSVAALFRGFRRRRQRRLGILDCREVRPGHPAMINAVRRGSRGGTMIGTKRPALRISGSGGRLRLHLAPSPDSLATVRECCRAATAVDKALGEAIRGAVAAGHSWSEG